MLLQRADPAQAGRGGEPHALGEFDVGHAAVLLKERQDPHVDLVEPHRQPTLLLHCCAEARGKHKIITRECNCPTLLRAEMAPWGGASDRLRNPYGARWGVAEGIGSCGSTTLSKRCSPPISALPSACNRLAPARRPDRPPPRAPGHARALAAAPGSAARCRSRCAPPARAGSISPIRPRRWCASSRSTRSRWRSPVLRTARLTTADWCSCCPISRPPAARCCATGAT